MADGNTILSGSHDETVRMWNATTGVYLREFRGHTESVMAVCALKDGVHVVSASQDTTLRVWNTSSGMCVRVLEGHSKVSRLDG
jgi:hypothetical protein